MDFEKNVPLPDARAKGPRFRPSEMEIGDSFAFPLANLNSIRTALGHYKRVNPGFGYATRVMSKTEARAWRTA